MMHKITEKLCVGFDYFTGIYWNLYGVGYLFSCLDYGICFRVVSCEVYIKENHSVSFLKGTFPQDILLARELK